MTQSNETIPIERMNEAIAEFMGYYFHAGKFYAKNNDCVYRWFAEAKYHTSWDWLMPVVEKIAQLDDGKYNFHISSTGQWACYINRDDVFDSEIASFGGFEPMILNAYKAVYKFITWYNQQKQNNG